MQRRTPRTRLGRARRAVSRVLQAFQPTLRPDFPLLFSACLGVLLTWLLFRNAEWEPVLGAFGEIQFPWLLAALGLAFVTRLLRVQRWSCILHTTRPTPFRSLFSAAQIGFLFNVNRCVLETLCGRLRWHGWRICKGLNPARNSSARES
jgi:uncharacterized membrane protein YbhN (UPF0104 family)